LHPIFLITHEFHPKRGGIATFTEEIARATAGLGWEIEVWAQAAGVADGKAWPFPLRRLALRGTHGLACQVGMARQLIRERRRLRYATVYLPEPGPMLAMMFLQYFKTFRPHRLVLTFHGSEVLRFHRNPLLRFHTRRLIAHASRISTLTHYTRQLLCARFPGALEKTFLTPGALRADFIADERTSPPSLARPSKRPSLDASPDGQRLIVLTVGRLHPRKGQLLTLEALRALPPHWRARVEYWLVGERSAHSRRSHYEESLRAAAGTADFPVRFLGDLPDDELARVYERADLFAMTSIDYRHSVEGFGLVYLEAAAHGLPIVAHAVGGVPEAMVDGETGLLVPPHHPVQLTAAFEKLLRDPALRDRLGAAGRRWARRNRWEHAARLLFQPDPPADENPPPRPTAAPF
jgi:glycosyltransferase involved in cell wall biosynthesis